MEYLASVGRRRESEMFLLSVRSKLGLVLPQLLQAILAKPGKRMDLTVGCAGWRPYQVRIPYAFKVECFETKAFKILPITLKWRG
jgi:hypothetical protein